MIALTSKKPRSLVQSLASMRQWKREILLHLFVVAVVLAATLAAYQDSSSLMIRANSEPSRVFHNFHEIERDRDMVFRWTQGESSICVGQFGSVPRTSITISLIADGAVPLGIDEVTFLVNNQSLVTTALPSQTRTYRLLLADQIGNGEQVCITIASATVQPPGDGRLVGIPFQWLVMTRVIVGGIVLPSQTQMLLNLILALLCLWLLRSVGVSSWLSFLLVILPAAIIGAAVARGEIALGLDITRHMLPIIGMVGAMFAGSMIVRMVEAWIFPRILSRTHADGSPIVPYQLARDLLLMIIWSGILVSGVWMLQQVSGHHGVWPLKAGVWPYFTPMVLIAVGGFAAWLALILLRLRTLLASDTSPTTRNLMAALALVLIGAVVLPVALKVSVRGWDSLFYTFRDNPTDYIHDVPRIDDPVAFLGEYVAISPDLAWHNANHPPGSVLLLWGVAQLIAPGPYVATWVAIVLSSMSAGAAFWLGWRIGGAHLALLSGALYVTMPAHQVYSVTSMDSVFNGILALGLVAFFVALQPGAKLWHAVLAGALIATGLFFTFAATQLAFFGAAVAMVAFFQHSHSLTTLRQSGIAALTIILIYLGCYLITGFNVIESAIQATQNNARFEVSRDLFVPASLDHYVRFLALNIVPFAWYLGPWGLAALTPFVVNLIRRRRWVLEPTSIEARLVMLTIGIIALVGGMWLGGLFIREVERIWAFTYPLMAVLIAHHAWQGTTPHEQYWRIGMYLSLFFTQSVVIRMLLNTYW